MDFVEIEIVNWSNYNRRAEYKHPRWFALSNSLFENPTMFDLTLEEKAVWIYILCQASRSNSSRIKLYFKHAMRIAMIKPKLVNDTLAKLEKVECIQLHVRDTAEDVRDNPSTVHNSTVHNRTNNIAHARAFALFWEVYPRKVGKGKAEKVFIRELSSGLPPDEIMKATANYLAHLRREKTESKFILHGSTFMNQWKDWLDPEHGKSESFSSKGDSDAAERALFEKAVGE